MDLYSKAVAAKDHIVSVLGESPIKAAIITGTGLSGISSEIEKIVSIPYHEIPFFKSGSVESHKNQLIYGHLNGELVLLFIGRFHYYEGFSMEEITFPIRVIQQLGIENVVFTNAAGGLSEDQDEGDVVMVRDHIYLMPENPLRGPNDERLGLRFPDMSNVYSKELRKKIQIEIPDIKEGVYACWQGPSLETPAEYNYLHHAGADLIGMSTIPEVIVACHAGINVILFSVVTNVCFPPEKVKPTTIADVIKIAEGAQKRLNSIIKRSIKLL